MCSGAGNNVKTALLSSCSKLILRVKVRVEAVTFGGKIVKNCKKIKNKLNDFWKSERINKKNQYNC